MAEMQYCKRLVAILIVGLVTGCGMLKDAVRSVHRLQNEVARVLAAEALAAEAQNNQKALTSLYQAEDELNTSCSFVKLVGNNKFWERDVKVVSFYKALSSRSACEAKAQEIRDYLQQLNMKEKGASARAGN